MWYNRDPTKEFLENFGGIKQNLRIYCGSFDLSGIIYVLKKMQKGTLKRLKTSLWKTTDKNGIFHNSFSF